MTEWHFSIIIPKINALLVYTVIFQNMEERGSAEFPHNLICSKINDIKIPKMSL